MIRGEGGGGTHKEQADTPGRLAVSYVDAKPRRTALPVGAKKKNGGRRVSFTTGGIAVTVVFGGNSATIKIPDPRGRLGAPSNSMSCEIVVPCAPVYRGLKNNFRNVAYIFFVYLV